MMEMDGANCAVSEWKRLNLNQSTYQASFTPPSITSLPPIKFSQPLAFELPDLTEINAVRVREFPIIPLGPRRNLTLEIPGPSHPVLAPGLGSRNLRIDRYLGKKPIIQTSNPRDGFAKEHGNPDRQLYQHDDEHSNSSLPKISTNGPLCDIQENILDLLIKELRWKTTLQKAHEEAHSSLPKVEELTTTFEDNADLVRLHPIRFENASADWQRVAPGWDKSQLRHPVDTYLNTVVQGSKPKVIPQRRMLPKIETSIDIREKILQLVKENILSSSLNPKNALRTLVKMKDDFLLPSMFQKHGATLQQQNG